MESRIVQQVKVHYVIMNPVYDRMESRRTPIAAWSKEKLIAFIQEQKVQGYKGDDNYYKIYKQEGPLEFMNPLRKGEIETPGDFGHGFYSQWIDAKTFILNPETFPVEDMSQEYILSQISNLIQ
jgi:hypothetical protein